jgi:hypothetical protein
MRVYAIACRPPVEGAQLVAEQFRLAHSYHCALVAIERRRRAVVDQLYRRACPVEWAALEEAKAAVESAVQAVRLSRSTGGESSVDAEIRANHRRIVTDAETLLVETRQRQKAAAQAWYDAKRAAMPRLRPRLRMCDRGGWARAKRAYNLGAAVNLAWARGLKIGQWDRGTDAGRSSAGRGARRRRHALSFGDCRPDGVAERPRSQLAHRHDRRR